ncbi:MAG: 3-deoxy-manno-octulosonate cytidylyltransferase [Acidobacteriota bacterium]|nr:3-deoxy-manno-octulosonate cytidylyltransferase [Acidobacteriota bacterium]
MAVAIIPARYDSVRLPGKALLEIAGKPMICHVVERALSARNVSRVIVATDDDRIRRTVESAGYECVMTRVDHASGTDRIAEVASSLPEASIIVNVQGDEPLISSETIERAVEEMGGEGSAIVTTWEPIESAADVLNPDVVKVIANDREEALYFSRSPIPYPRDAVREHGSIEAALRNKPLLVSTFRKHTGLYVYRRDVLIQFTQWPQTELERQERLEQLRALEHGVRIKVIKASTSSIGVDTPEDLKRVRSIVGEEFQVSGLKSQVS